PGEVRAVDRGRQLVPRVSHSSVIVSESRRWSAKSRRRRCGRKGSGVSNSAALWRRGFSHWVFPRRSQTPRCWNPIGLNEPGDGRQVVGEGISGPKLFESLSHNTEPFGVTGLGRLRSPAHEQFV